MHVSCITWIHIMKYLCSRFSIQWFDTVGWATGRASGLWKN